MRSRYKYKRIYSWSPELSYCVGLIATDGSLSVNGRHIDFTSTDYELTDIFRSIICPHVKIGTKAGKDKKIAYRVQHGNVALYDFLLNTGLSVNKSKTIPGLLIPDEYYRDFLRGCFDGDGTSYAFWDKRWRSSYVYNLTYISASSVFLNWIRSQNALLALTTPGGITTMNKGTRVYRLSYGKADTKVLFDYMYYKPGLPCLNRKKKRLMSYFTEERLL